MLTDAGVRGADALLNLGGTLVLSLGVKLLLRRERSDVDTGEDIVDSWAMGSEVAATFVTSFLDWKLVRAKVRAVKNSRSPSPRSQLLLNLPQEYRDSTI